jgi:hypothetical protein
MPQNQLLQKIQILRDFPLFQAKIHCSWITLFRCILALSQFILFKSIQKDGSFDSRDMTLDGLKRAEFAFFLHKLVLKILFWA